jgi:NADPH:quinone reductase
VAPAANLHLYLGVITRGGTIVTYGADSSDLRIPPRDLVVANVTLRFLGIYGVPESALRPAHRRGHERADQRRPQRAAGARYELDEIAAAHEAAEAGAIGKVLIDIE